MSKDHIITQQARARGSKWTWLRFPGGNLYGSGFIISILQMSIYIKRQWDAWMAYHPAPYPQSPCIKQSRAAVTQNSLKTHTKIGTWAHTYIRTQPKRSMRDKQLSSYLTATPSITQSCPCRRCSPLRVLKAESFGFVVWYNKLLP